MKRENRLVNVLFNAISMLIDETYEQYEDNKEWFKMIQNNLDCNKEELMELGIEITEYGGLDRVKGKHVIKSFETDKLLDEYIGQESFEAEFEDVHNKIFPGNSILFVNKGFTKILLPYVYTVQLAKDCKKFRFEKYVPVNMKREGLILNKFKHDNEQEIL